MSKQKVVVRRLPPALTEEGFLQTVDKLIEGQYDWHSFFPGKSSQKRVLFGRAYINFLTPEAVIAFKHAFDGHLFVGAKGSQYRASVEYAPFQKTPSLSAKKDAHAGTIFKDPDYIDFIKLLEQGPESLPSASAQLEAQERAAGGTSAEGVVVVTPLMEFIQQKYASNPSMKLGTHRGKKRDGPAVLAPISIKAPPNRKPKPEDSDSRVAPKQLQPQLLASQKPRKDSSSTAVAAALASAKGRAGGGKPVYKAVGDESASAPPATVLMGKGKPQAEGRREASAPSKTPKPILDAAAARASQQAVTSAPPAHQKQAKAQPPQRGSYASKEPTRRTADSSTASSSQTLQDKPSQSLRQEAGSRPVSARPSAGSGASSSQADRDRKAADAAAASVLRQLPTRSGALPSAGDGSSPAGEAATQSRRVRTGFQAYVPRSARQTDKDNNQLD